MRGEFDALRRVAHLASDYLELRASHMRDGVGGATTLRELRAALDDLRTRFPYILEAPAAVELDAALSRNLRRRYDE